MAAHSEQTLQTTGRLSGHHTLAYRTSKAVAETASARQPWSWLKTLVLYKLNPRRAANQMPELAVIHTEKGAAITVVTAPVVTTEHEDADTAPPHTAPPSRKRPSDFTSAGAQRRRAIGGDTPAQASSASAALQTLGSRIKAPGVARRQLWSERGGQV